MRNLHCRFDWHYIGQIYVGDFATFCGLLRMYELYIHIMYLIYLVASEKANNLLVFFVVPFVTILLYTYYHGIIDHSGITFKRHWWQPWQPDCIFHDNHHQYFHVNFGFNIELWDKVS